jgi:hypothetical protein
MNLPESVLGLLGRNPGEGARGKLKIAPGPVFTGGLSFSSERLSLRSGRSDQSRRDNLIQFR